MGPAKRDEKDRGFLSRQEFWFAVPATLLLLIVVLAASIRHSVLCESGLSEATSASATLDRQSFESRLLNAEQEAMENMILVQRVLREVEQRHAAAPPADLFAEMYADADKLALEIDAAFDRSDDDAFAQDQARQPGGVEPQDDVRNGARGYDDDPHSVDLLPPPGEYGSLNSLDARLDDVESSPRREALYAAEMTDEPRGNTPAAKCADLKARWRIVAQVSWGDAPVHAQQAWRSFNCDVTR
ncbi:hypothetical protein M885DRAFT_516510 [Pelagophyceae sp. CCMP2097]|nr:hypothetical protein M885DRAFT_516510 [Pelagophyceae sp. CCMP2097]